MNPKQAQYLPHEFEQAVERVGRHHAPSYRLAQQLPGITAEKILADRKLIRELTHARDTAAAWTNAEEIHRAASNLHTPLDAGDFSRLGHSAELCIKLVFALHDAALRLDRELGLASGPDGKQLLRIPGDKRSIARVLDYADRADLRAVSLARALLGIFGGSRTRVLDRETDRALAEILRGNKQRREARIALRNQRIHVGKVPLKPGQVKVRFDTGLVAESLPDEIECAECEKCGASMTERTRRKGAHYLSCGYCGHSRELAAPAARIAVAQDLASTLREQRTLLQPLPDMIGWRCNECGAEAVTSASGIVARCAYCGSTHFTRVEGEGVMRPQGMLRFACDQDRAVEMIREQLRAQTDVAFGFARDFEVETAQARYVPYWVFNVTEPFGKAVSNLCSCASRQLLHRLPTELRAIEPFPIAALPPFEPSHLVGTVAERYSVDVEEALAHSFKLGNEEDRSLAGVNDLPRGTSVAFRYVLVPVWFFVLRWKGCEYHALVDGSGAGVGIRYPKTPVRKILRLVPHVAAGLLTVPAVFLLLQWLTHNTINRAEADRMAQTAALVEHYTLPRRLQLEAEDALRAQFLASLEEAPVAAPDRPTGNPPTLPQPAPTVLMFKLTSQVQRGNMRIHADDTVWIDLSVQATASGHITEEALDAMLKPHLPAMRELSDAQALDLVYDDQFGLHHRKDWQWRTSLSKQFSKCLPAQAEQVQFWVNWPSVRFEEQLPERMVRIEGKSPWDDRAYTLTLRIPEGSDRRAWIDCMRHGDLHGEIDREIADTATYNPDDQPDEAAIRAVRTALRRWLHIRQLPHDTLAIEDFALQ